MKSLAKLSELGNKRISNGFMTMQHLINNIYSIIITIIFLY